MLECHCQDLTASLQLLRWDFGSQAIHKLAMGENSIDAFSLLTTPGQPGLLQGALTPASLSAVVRSPVLHASRFDPRRGLLLRKCRIFLRID